MVIANVEPTVPARKILTDFRRDFPHLLAFVQWRDAGDNDALMHALIYLLR